MRLLKFTARRVHGYLQYDVVFNDKLTFLTGINGSGKTTALNLIVALISPNLATLQSIEFEKARIDFEDDLSGRSFVEAIKVGNKVRIVAGSSKNDFEFDKFPNETAIPRARDADAEAEYYRSLLLASTSNAALTFIASLPTPMFLGLDRRARLDADDPRATSWRARSVSVRNIFGGSATGSLNDAIDLAEMAYREANFRSGRIGDELQREMLLGLLTFAPEDFGGIVVPTRGEKRNLERVRADLETLPVIFNLPKSEVQKRVTPFIIHLQKIVNKIPDGFDIADLLKKEGDKRPPFFSELIKWSTNRSQLKRIMVISETVASYNERRNQVMEPIEKYILLINKFLNDSGKSIGFDDHGGLYVQIDGIQERRTGASLSSGESQLLVILTQLSFNQSAQRGNVFIIDEPELSLHVYWQELFVDSIIAANPRIQYVLATHSPSIILDRLTSCVDLTAKRVKVDRRG